ncbi:hypothetical protein GCM10010917_40420 [Paenibacillus physcomitrellae]|uniref:Uncharacterized protein n=1 Tax=Paenibacillus physcomitrellae TaxID=1619311 RepID=A0ABQ1GVX5_9BACL|nr:hypothetical protein GCM10010917_40420 [Paenibacillus physcomitrellae]
MCRWLRWARWMPRTKVLLFIPVIISIGYSKKALEQRNGKKYRESYRNRTEFVEKFGIQKKFLNLG